jgi:hypothetical protein
MSAGLAGVCSRPDESFEFVIDEILPQAAGDCSDQAEAEAETFCHEGHEEHEGILVGSGAPERKSS